MACSQKQRHGFTLLELLMAMCVLLIAVVALLQVYLSTWTLNETTRNANLALAAAQGKMEEIRTASAISSIYTNYDGYTFTVPGMASGESLGYVVVNNTDPDFVDVAIGVCWRQKAGQIIGECQMSSGVLNFSDTNGNGILDSPVSLRASMAQR